MLKFFGHITTAVKYNLPISLNAEQKKKKKS